MAAAGPTAEVSAFPEASPPAAAAPAEDFLTSPWSFAAVGVLGASGVAGATILRRHGRPD
jgi:hypothetical protein